MRTHRPVPRPLLLALMACPAVAWAQDKAPEEKEKADQTVTIIGVSPLPGLNVPKERVAGNAQAANAAQIERSNAVDLSSFMNRRLASVHLNEMQNNPFQPDVNYRGFTASPLLGSAQGLSVYMDGVRLNQPFGDVVSWDLVPKSAIASITLMPGSNPLFGMNTLGGALSVQTKDGRKNAGTSMQVQAGSHKRRAAEFEHGFSLDSGLHGFVTGQVFKEAGWRDDSPSDVKQLFGKLGGKAGPTGTEWSITAALARTDLNGNGLQEQRFLARDYKSVYTKPDSTKNDSKLLNLAFTRGLNETLSLSGNLYWRRIDTKTYNGDLNGDSLDQAVYQPNATELAALTAAGYTGLPTAGESSADTPFPKWRCIAQALLKDEPAEKCNGVINQTRTVQSQRGLSLQLNHQGEWLGLRAQSLAGLGYDRATSRFVQGSELGYLNPDRSITGVGAFGDGVSGGDVDGKPYDTRVDLAGRTATASLFASTILELAKGTHLTVAGRYNRMTVTNRDAINPGGASGGSGSLDGDHRFARFNPALGLTFTPAEGLNAYAGISQGSRAPSSVELGCADPANPCKLPNAFAGDPPLKQVVTTTVETGLRGGSASRFAWNVGLFRSDNRDDLLFVSDNASGFGYFRNFGHTRRQGLEAGVSLVVTKGLTLSASLTLLDATYRSPEVVNGASNSSNRTNAEEGLPGVDGTISIHPGDRIPLVPRRLLKLGADYEAGAWTLGLDVNASGGATARGNENGQHQSDGVYYLGPGRSAGYAVANLSAGFKPTANSKVFVQVNNVFDRQYATAAQLGATGFNAAGNFEARPFPANTAGQRPLRRGTFFAPGAPRAVSLGVKVGF